MNNDYDISENLKTKFAEDPFPKHLGIKIMELQPGYAKLSIQVQPHMANILGITHGGIVFTLADAALGVASNARGVFSVAINVNISYIKSSKSGDVLIAVAEELHSGRRTANYKVTIEDEQGKLIALAQGLVFQEQN